MARERALQSGVSLTPSKTEPYWACPEGLCEAIVDPPAHKVGGHWILADGLRALEGSGEKGGYDPADLQSAYGISTSGGEAQQHYEEKQTLALVDVGYIPSAESNLAEYRSHYGLPPCTKAGGCFRQVNEQGEEGKPPRVDEEWNLETTLDIDMASAMCPHCHVLLVESTHESLADLAVSASTAARLGATEISNSYGFPENQSLLEGGEQKACGENHCQELDSDYNHPGVVITVGAGDGGYDNYLRGGTAPLFPAVSPTVIAVGGTSLHKTTEGRKWAESVWWETEKSLGTGSGCSALRSKPTWQADSGCAHRTDNDVAAVAACETPVSIYSPHLGGWANVCGTSVSSPLVAGIEAHANEAGGAVPTADAFYKDRSSLYDVTKGRNDTSCSPEYLCSAEAQLNGYDGPAGNGTPASGSVVAANEAPSVRTGSPTAANSGQVTVDGVVDPNGAETNYRFEYGPTASYGSSAPTPEGSVGAGVSPKEVSQPIAVSQRGIYHYRLVATNSGGTVYGEDATFGYGPVVRRVEPNAGGPAGGTSVQITGTGLTSATAVKFGSRNAASFTVNSDTSITAVSPAGTGTVDVTVTNPVGTSQSTTADRFEYAAAQQVAKLIGGEEPKSGDLGWQVSLSADGNTALASGPGSGEPGGAWIFTRSGSTWTQQGPRLAGTKEVGAAQFGSSSALSGDGNTALIGGPYDNSQAGAAWVFTRSGSTWSQQGKKLAITSEPSEADFGRSVALSADGNTALIGGAFFNGSPEGGAVWVFTRSGSTWTQGQKLTGNGYFGESVALSADGTTALIGAPTLHSAGVFTRSGSTWTEVAQLTGSGSFGGSVALSAEATTALIGDRPATGEEGAAWVFTRSGSSWTEQATLSGGGGVGLRGLGSSVALSAAGNVALVGAPHDNGWLGAAWLFTRSGSTWSQTGGKLTGAEEIGWASFGHGVALSSDGATILVGGPDDNNEVLEPVWPGHGAAWVFASLFPTVTNVAPHSGPASGGTSVTITGTNFTGASTVKFGQANATSFQVNSETSITAVAPAGKGPNDVTVTTPAGTSPTSPADQFTYGPTYSMSSVFFCLCIPTAVAADSKGHLFVADWYESRVQEYGEGGEYLGQLGSAGSGPGQYERPKGIAVDSKGNVWVVDEGNARVEEFNEAGGYVSSLGSPGTGPGQFQSPSAVAGDAKGDVWVSDDAGSVQEFNEKGEYVRGVGSFGSGPGQFEWPTGVAVDAKGDLWVADLFNHRVQELGEKGEYLGQFGSKGEGAGRPSYPDGVAVDSQGNVYVADIGNSRVEEFTERGEALATIGSFLSGPTGVAVDSKGNVWASEGGADRVERWTGTP